MVESVWGDCRWKKRCGDLSKIMRWYEFEITNGGENVGKKSVQSKQTLTQLGEMQFSWKLCWDISGGFNPKISHGNHDAGKKNHSWRLVDLLLALISEGGTVGRLTPQPWFFNQLERMQKMPWNEWLYALDIVLWSLGPEKTQTGSLGVRKISSNCLKKKGWCWWLTIANDIWPGQSYFLIRCAVIRL